MAIEAGGSWYQRRAAIRTLVEKAERGDNKAVSELLACLGDSSDDVREASALALASVADVHHEKTLAALGDMLADGVADVRSAAAKALGELAGGDARVIEQLSGVAIASNEDPSVRAAALNAIRVVAADLWTRCKEKSPDSQLISTMTTAVVECTGDVDIMVARIALETLAAVAHKTPAPAVVEAVTAAFSRKAPRLRIVALAALADLQAGQGALSQQVVIEHLRVERDSDARAAAFAALAQVATKGNEEVISMLCAASQEPCSSVRKIVYEVLQLAVPHGHCDAGLCAVKGIKDTDSDVRKAAMASLLVIAEPGDNMVIESLAACLESGSKDLRCVAISALQALFPNGDRTLVEVCKRFNHKSKQIRSHMVTAASSLGGVGSPLVVAACVKGLQDATDDGVRADALRALERLFPEGNKLSLQHVARTASEDYITENQCLALQLLRKTAKGKKVAMLVAAHALGERDRDVVQEGFKTLVAVSPLQSTYALDCLVEMLPLKHLTMDERVDRRMYILDGMAHIGAGTNHEGSVLALVERSRDLNPLVGAAALSALQSVACISNPTAINAVADLLESPDVEIRMLAIDRLRRFGSPFDPVAASAAIERTSSSRFEIRVAALHALAGVLDPGQVAVTEPGATTPFCADQEILARLRIIASQDEYHPVKAAASAILRHLEKWEPMPAAGLRSVVYAPMGDPMRFAESGGVGEIADALDSAECANGGYPAPRTWERRNLLRDPGLLSKAKA